MRTRWHNFLFLIIAMMSVLFANGCSMSSRDSHIYALEQEEIPIALDEIIEDETDLACSYFYFLWGRYAEVSGLLDAALEAYEKALICDPASVWIARKIPLILLQLGREDEAKAQLHQYLARKPDDITARMLLAKVFIRQKLYEKAIKQYNYIFVLESQIFHDDNTIFRGNFLPEAGTLAQTKQPHQFRSLLLISELYLGLQRFDEAKQTLEKFISISDKPYSGHLFLARLFAYKNKFAYAHSQYKAALKIHWSLGLELELAGLYLREKKYSEVEKIYKRLLEKDSTNKQVAMSLVNVYLLQGKVQDAHQKLARLQGISTDLEQLELSLAGIYAQQKQFDQAIEVLQGLLLREDSPRARYLLAITFIRQKKYEEALTELEQISSEAEEYMSAVLLQVRILNRLQRFEEGIFILENVLVADGRPLTDIFILLANMYERQGDHEASENIFKQALSIHPNNDDLFYEFALFLYRWDKIIRALTIMKKVIALNPDHAKALNFIGFTWADRDENLEQALEYIKRAVYLKPENGYIRDSLGWVYFRLGYLDKARKELEKALELAPDTPEILEHLGEVYLESGLQEKGLEAYRRALKFFEMDEDKQRIQDKIRIVEEGEDA